MAFKIIIYTVLAAALFGAGFFYGGYDPSRDYGNELIKDSVANLNPEARTPQTGGAQTEKSDALQSAVKAGKQLSNNQCSGSGIPYKLGRSPMDPEDFSIVIPYGLMIDSHVTPIDHQYFSPKDYYSPRDAYEVYAMADSDIVEIEERKRPEGFTEYRIIFSITCTYFYYYDLVTSLAPEIRKAYEDARLGYYSKRLKIKVTEGQLIGRIGGQTLDFAVWDTTKPLSGFVVPEHYNVEPWKIYTADPLLYYTDELKNFILTRYIRTAAPISGKIDYDIDGKAIGNWFLSGTEGYGSAGGEAPAAYWDGHLSISPEHIDPTALVFSIGKFNGRPAQFLVMDPSPRPEDVGVESGVARYRLKKYSFKKPDGSYWDRNSVAKDLKAVPAFDNETHCALIQMIEARKLKTEVFSNKNCSPGLVFTENAKIYTR